MHLKSNWTTDALWFSNTPDTPIGLKKQPLPKKILAKRLGKLCSRQMKIAMKPLTLAKTRRAAEHSSFQRFSFQRFSFTQSPLFPRNPLFPALRSSPTAVQEPPAKSKFLAVKAPPVQPMIWYQSGRLSQVHRLCLS